MKYCTHVQGGSVNMQHANCAYAKCAGACSISRMRNLSSAALAWCTAASRQKQRFQRAAHHAGAGKAQRRRAGVRYRNQLLGSGGGVVGECGWAGARAQLPDAMRPLQWRTRLLATSTLCQAGCWHACRSVRQLSKLITRRDSQQHAFFRRAFSENTSFVAARNCSVAICTAAVPFRTEKGRWQSSPTSGSPGCHRSTGRHRSRWHYRAIAAPPACRTAGWGCPRACVTRPCRMSAGSRMAALAPHIHVWPGRQIVHAYCRMRQRTHSCCVPFQKLDAKEQHLHGS